MAAAVLLSCASVVTHENGFDCKIGRVRCPKLFIHSRGDEVVPFELGRRLYEAAPEPKQFYEVQGAPHNSTYIVGGKPYFDACAVSSSLVARIESRSNNRTVSIEG